ncbi:SMI1/KNR4 family protein [Nannocystis pusilla]|uniref:SMI1/KNR4 family protein n=1 Tax=Nannocystis pusilla TaxID=889268 RepID=UPI003BF2302D
MTAIDDVLVHFAEKAKKSHYPLEGCSENEIQELEQFAGSPLPQAYVKFLRLAGRNSAAVTIGTDCYYPLILELREVAVELLAEAPRPSILPDNMFVFSMHQGYAFCCFPLDEGEDPPVYRFIQHIDDFTGLRLAVPTFSEYLEGLLHPTKVKD